MPKRARVSRMLESSFALRQRRIPAQLHYPPNPHPRFTDASPSPPHSAGEPSVQACGRLSSFGASGRSAPGDLGSAVGIAAAVSCGSRVLALSARRRTSRSRSRCCSRPPRECAARRLRAAPRPHARRRDNADQIANGSQARRARASPAEDRVLSPAQVAQYARMGTRPVSRASVFRSAIDRCERRCAPSPMGVATLLSRSGPVGATNVCSPRGSRWLALPSCAHWGGAARGDQAQLGRDRRVRGRRVCRSSGRGVVTNASLMVALPPGRDGGVQAPAAAGSARRDGGAVVIAARLTFSTVVSGRPSSWIGAGRLRDACDPAPAVQPRFHSPLLARFRRALALAVNHPRRPRIRSPEP